MRKGTFETRVMFMLQALSTGAESSHLSDKFDIFHPPFGGTILLMEVTCKCKNLKHITRITCHCTSRAKGTGNLRPLLIQMSFSY